MIDLINVSLQFGGKYLFREVSFKINSGDRISLVGANGTGKSSLLKMIYQNGEFSGLLFAVSSIRALLLLREGVYFQVSKFNNN